MTDSRRVVARIDEVGPGVWEAGVSREPASPVTVASDERIVRFETRAAAEAWVRQQAGGEPIWIEE